MSNVVEVTPGQVPAFITYHNTNNFPVFLRGAPGVGKSTLVRQYAEDRAAENGWGFFHVGPNEITTDPANTFGFIDLRLSTVDCLDLKGGLKVNEEKQITEFIKTGILPDAERHGHYGVLFLDELPDAFPMTLAGVSQLILDRRIGDNYRLPDGWHIVAAGNRKEDNASAKALPSQLADRFAIVDVIATVPDFAKYLLTKGSDGRLGAFIRLRPELLHHYQGKSDVVYPTPRSWEAVEQAIQTIDDRDFRELVIGSHVGVGPASELEGFLAMAGQLTTWKEIVDSPTTARVPEIGSSQCVAAQFAITGMIANKVDIDTIDQAITYVERLPEREIQATFILDLQTKKPELIDTTAVSRWRANNHDVAV